MLRNTSDQPMTSAGVGFAHRFRVRFSEVDMHGHVFNANYLTYCDTAITEFLRHCKYEPATDARIEGMSFIVVRTSIDYKGSIRFDEVIDAHVKVTRVGRSSLAFGVDLCGKDRSDLRATAEVVWVAVDPATRSTAAVPRQFVERITKE